LFKNTRIVEHYPCDWDMPPLFPGDHDTTIKHPKEKEMWEVVRMIWPDDEWTLPTLCEFDEEEENDDAASIPTPRHMSQKNIIDQGFYPKHHERSHDIDAGYYPANHFQPANQDLGYYPAHYSYPISLDCGYYPASYDMFDKGCFPHGHEKTTPKKSTMSSIFQFFIGDREDGVSEDEQEDTDDWMVC